jgi:hypothetical protein
LNRLVITSTVGSDGVLRLAVPLGVAAAHQDVRITIEPAAHRRPMTQEEWRSFVMSTAGSIPDPTFIRHEQGDYERRADLP